MPKMRTTPVEAVETCHKLLLWLVPHLEKFPRYRRFTLGDRLESTLLMVLEEVIEASYSREKQAYCTGPADGWRWRGTCGDFATNCR